MEPPQKINAYLLISINFISEAGRPFEYNWHHQFKNAREYADDEDIQLDRRHES
jgi:hypothetical protein